MQKESLYNIISLEINTDKTIAKSVFTLNPHNDIFKGHFPGNPVLPGVCVIQIIKDIVSQISGCDIMLSEANTIKFQNPVIPEENAEITADFKIRNEEGKIIVNAQIASADKVYGSFKGDFVVRT